MSWRARLNADPIRWLLEAENPGIRYFTLVDLLDRPLDDPEVVAARSKVNASQPVKTLLEAQHPEGYWVKSGPGYSPKYRSTVWSVIFLDQLGADPSDPRVQAACEYLLSHTPAPNGGFGCSAREDATQTPNLAVLHCLNGNLLRALLGFGYADDPRVQRAIEWQAGSITGEGFSDYFPSGTSGPGFACAINEGDPCAWGAIKALRGLARVPATLQSPLVRKALRQGTAFLLSRDPAQADYPRGSAPISRNWFKLGFPSGYVADVLQNLEVLAELGHARDRRLRPALDWLLAKQNADGRWRNEHRYGSQLWTSFEPGTRGSSRWVTLRACRVLKAAAP